MNELKILLCKKCNCMSHTIVDDGFFVCGKCRELKHRDTLTDLWDNKEDDYWNNK